MQNQIKTHYQQALLSGKKELRSRFQLEKLRQTTKVISKFARCQCGICDGVEVGSKNNEGVYEYVLVGICKECGDK